MFARFLNPIRRAKRSVRRGVATVELAVCLPVLLLLVVGAIESSNFIFLKQAATVAAYEAAAVTTRAGGTAADGQLRAQQILTARSIDSTSISFTPANPDNAARGTLVSVEVSAPVSTNSIGLDWFYDDQTVTASVTMVRD
jgi:Flp pilus assembly protein TadG